MGPLSFKETSQKSHKVHLLICHWSELSLTPHLSMREAEKYHLLVGRLCVQVRIITQLIWERSKKYPRRQLSKSAPDIKHIFVYWFILYFSHKKLALGGKGFILFTIVSLMVFCICLSWFAFMSLGTLADESAVFRKMQQVWPDSVRKSAVVNHERLQWPVRVAQAQGIPSNH